MPAYKKPRLRHIDIKQFRESLRRNAGQSVLEKSPLKVKRENGEYFVVLSAEEWESEQATMEVLNDTELVRKIGVALGVHVEENSKRRSSVGRGRSK